MFKKYNSYLPDLRESWILAINLVVGGSILGAIIALIFKLILPSLTGIEIIAYPLLFIPPYLWMRFSLKLSEKNEPIQINKPNFGKLGAKLSIILIFPLVFAFNIIIEPLYLWLEMPDFMIGLMNAISENRISSLIMLVVFAPVLEEVFCRGIILRGLLAHYSPTKAILWSAAFFGIIHMNPWQAIPAFLIGVLMGWIYWRTRSLWATIFIHFINNGVAYIITVFFPELPEDAGYFDIIPGVYYYIAFAAALIYTICILIIMNKSYDKPISNKV
ncbi:MAG: hypothetical protein A2X18_08280 [Bacteroidetes bacterium GWF2_40_14]|nr:MAG: hypothetical protein A2X18_08280 [Bacteroidetes bacterium GWF2_40_14]